MVWSHLDPSKAHVVYLILGAFTCIFMLCSSVIKEKLYIGEATVATLVGIIFGPIAANFINPLEWGNTDRITLEFARIVLVVQCFAVGVELPKRYMNRHWYSVSLLLLPVMAFGWLITSLIIWWLFRSHLNWLDSLVISACVTATDPVLASSVVGKGKFAKRVPRHLRDLLSAESGCNDGMAFPFIYLGIYLTRYHLDAGKVSFHWICYTILYECVFGTIYGFLIGYAARRAIRYAHKHDLIDRESFLVFYFVLALFCAGSGSLLGMDDLLIGFACGVGFSNDGWFQGKTEETHVSNVIDLLLNLSFFVYFGTIIPWNQFNSNIIGIHPWKLIVLAIFVLLFRRIPIMMILKPVIPDVKTWREALFAGHFGPIGVGAIFVAILARAELSTESTTPLAKLPPSGFPHLNIIEMIWPITTFLVLTSIVVHGSSVAVFTLGRHLNTLTISFSYTTGDEGPGWMERLPRIQSRSKSQMSAARRGESDLSLDEKREGLFSPANLPRNFLRRQREEDSASRTSSRGRRKSNKWDSGIGPGGPISQSAITPASRQFQASAQESDDLADQTPDLDNEVAVTRSSTPPQEHVYNEGNNLILENEIGEVDEVIKRRADENAHQAEIRASRRARQILLEREAGEGVDVDQNQSSHAQQSVQQSSHSEGQEATNHLGPQRSGWKSRLSGKGRRPSEQKQQSEAEHSEKPPRSRAHGPARAYTCGSTVIVEDEDGEVIKTYQIPSSKPSSEKRPTLKEAAVSKTTRDMLTRMGTYLGASNHEKDSKDSAQQKNDATKEELGASTDDNIRFTLAAGGPRLRKDEFIHQLAEMDARSRARHVENQDISDQFKHEVYQQANRIVKLERRNRSSTNTSSRSGSGSSLDRAKLHESVPAHAVLDSIAHTTSKHGGRETAAQRRRVELGQTALTPSTSSKDIKNQHKSDENVPARRPLDKPSRPVAFDKERDGSFFAQGETAAERRRREGALGLGEDDSSSDEDTGTGFRELKSKPARKAGARTEDMSSSGNSGPHDSRTNAHISDQSQRDTGGPRLRWGEDVRSA